LTAGIVDEDILKAEAEAGLTEEYFDARQKEVSFLIYLYNTYFIRPFFPTISICESSSLSRILAQLFIKETLKNARQMTRQNFFGFAEYGVWTEVCTPIVGLTIFCNTYIIYVNILDNACV
jgi:hypothetical protein